MYRRGRDCQRHLPRLHSPCLMEHKPVLRVAGPAWELPRFFLLIVFPATASSSSVNADMLSAPWLAAAGAGGLVMPAAFLMFAFAPGRDAVYLPHLRLCYAPLSLTGAR